MDAGWESSWFRMHDKYESQNNLRNFFPCFSSFGFNSHEYSNAGRISNWKKNMDRPNWLCYRTNKNDVKIEIELDIETKWDKFCLWRFA